MALPSILINVANILSLLQILIITTALYTSTTNLTFAHNSGPRLEISPGNDRHNVDTKKTFTLKCKPQGDNPNLFGEIRWSGPNVKDNWEELRAKHPYTNSKQSADGSSKLVFTSPSSTEDSGVYSCQSSFQGVDVLSKEIRLDFYSPIEVKDCAPNQFLVLRRDDEKISCSVSSLPGPSVEIVKDRKSFSKFEDRRYRFENPYIKIVKPVEESDAGNYTFTFTLDEIGITEERSIKVEVLKPPKIIESHEHKSNGPFYKAIEDQEITLRCNATGHPRPRILWFDAQKRNCSDQGGYQVNPEEGTLKIQRPSQIYDNGDFLCIARNQAGEVNMTIPVVVNVSPFISHFQNQTVEEKGEVVLECRSNGKPIPRFQIRKEGRHPYMKGDGFFVSDSLRVENDIHVYQLMLRDVSAELDGLHYCNSHNEAGHDERIAFLKVEFKPDLSQTMEIQYFKQRTPSILCLVKAFPAPKIQWYYEDNPLINVNQSSFSSDYRSHKFIMTPSNLSSSARFRCDAQNKMGTTSKVIRMESSRVPGLIEIIREDVGPTHAKLTLVANDDGGDEITSYNYEYIGLPATMNSPFFHNFTEHKFRSTLTAMLNRTDSYFIRDLRPRYSYSLTIAARNSIGIGKPSIISFNTPEPSRPNRPRISRINPSRESIIPSQYSNGYKLIWSEPESTGNNITKYIIGYKNIDRYNSFNSIEEDHVIEQLRDRPTFANVGPLRSGLKYLISIKAQNELGQSEPDQIYVYVREDQPLMPEFNGSTLPWHINEQSPVALSILILSLTLIMFAIDLTCCYFYKIGLSYILHGVCCKPRKGRVDDKSFDS